MGNYYGKIPDINKISHDSMVSKILEMAKNEEARILETDFINLYGKDEVERNLNTIIKLKKEFESQATYKDIEAKRLADVFEFIMNKQIELSDWLGENVYTYKTSYYDDWINGVDTLLEFQKEENASSYMGIAFDITYSENLYKKLHRIKKEIDSGHMASIKYFKSENEDFMGRLSNIPRLVIGADTKTIDELMEFEIGRKNKELADYFLQYQIIDEMIMQLDIFSKYAEKISKFDLAERYKLSLKIIKQILSNKRKNISKAQLNFMNVRDSFINSLEYYCDDVFGPLEK
ncbi:MAG TPA: hypothetical protein PLM63_01190 [bacterium]|nr:hypothetical protein [bacterium]HPO11182.1 hypothetical protein [bacterium]HQL11403.1 hypothetical protein [bacterium]